MAGGLLNIVAYGQQNIFLNGNPSKTFFKCAYAKYTNFGMQKFRLDFNGQRSLRLTDDSVFTFDFKRYADILLDHYIVVDLPHIWSPIFPPTDTYDDWVEYGFKWIKNLGSMLVKNIKITAGGQTLANYTGEYLYNVVERDFDETKKDLYYKMTGHYSELNDPAEYNGGVYPNAFYNSATNGIDPSIRAKQLMIPINSWFGLNSKMGFPLISLQYNTLQLEVTLRPIKDLFVIKDVSNPLTQEYIQPNFNDPNHSFYRFLQQPPSVNLNTSDYDDKRTNWNADVHIIATYAFLSNEERLVFATNEQRYLIKDTYQYEFKSISGPQKVSIGSYGMVSSWMWYFTRSDAYTRNQWSNYTNWPYDTKPYPLLEFNSTDAFESGYENPYSCTDGYYAHDNSEECTEITMPNLYVTPLYKPQNNKEILLEMAIVLDGTYRESLLAANVYNWIEKYIRTPGNGPDGLYCYNFCLDSSIFSYQPTGAMNMSLYSKIEFEFNVMPPTLDDKASFYTICDPVTKENIGVNKNNWQIYEYTYDMVIMEERYNILTFSSGNVGLMYARN